MQLRVADHGTKAKSIQGRGWPAARPTSSQETVAGPPCPRDSVNMFVRFTSSRAVSPAFFAARLDRQEGHAEDSGVSRLP